MLSEFRLHGPVDCELVIEALNKHTMRWTTGDQPATFSPTDVANEIRTWIGNKAMKNLVPQADDLFGFRMYWGSFALLAQFAAPVDLRRIVREELDRADIG